MKCLHPITIKAPNSVQLREIRYRRRNGETDQQIKSSPPHRYMEVPCGYCVACLSNRRSAWTIRLWDEFQRSTNSIFVTLTYDDAHLPSDGMLEREDPKKFFKRFRKNLNLKGLRYLLCGEYGGKFKRPHYHVLMFGLPDNRDWWSFIQKNWPLGYVSVFDVNASRIGYMTKYLLKPEENAELRKIKKQPYITASHGLGLGLVDRINYDMVDRSDYTIHEYGQSGVLPRYVREKMDRPTKYAYLRWKASRAQSRKGENREERFSYEIMMNRRLNKH